MNKQETIADIIAEKRLRAAEMEKTLGDQHSFVESLKDDADRLEAAWKREKSVIEADALSAGGLVQAMRQKMATAENSSAVGDAAKLREALSDACYAMFNFLKTQNGGHEEMANALDKAKAALAAPARNCDVGTAEEQSRRFCAFCRPRLEPCDGCPCLEGSRHGRCEFGWAQMPYEEGGANE